MYTAPTYTCNTVHVDGRRCRKSCWGRTAFCRWHNAALLFQMMKMRLFSRHGSPDPDRAPFDPDLANSVVPSNWAATSISVVMIAWYCGACVLVAVLNVPSLQLPLRPVEALVTAALLVALQCAFAM